MLTKTTGFPLQLPLKFPHANNSAAIIAKVCPTANNGSAELVPVHASRIDTAADTADTYSFTFQKLRYVWDADKAQFGSTQFPTHETYGTYAAWRGHATDASVATAARRYGTNTMEMLVPEFWKLFIERATAPFFVFQIFSVGLWCLDEYWYYSLFTLFMLVVFEFTLVQQQLRNMAEIRRMGNKPHLVNVYRNARWRPVLSDQLVAGDIASIGRPKADSVFVPCDVLVLRGSCIVDESMLTGESVPQLKESLENAGDRLDVQLDAEGEGKLFVLFGGTKVVQHTAPAKSAAGALRAPDDGCIVYVLRTGFNTSQGKLLRTILFGVKRITANNLETFAFILFLLIFAVAAAAYVWIRGTEDATRSRYKLFLECTLIITNIIPPDLPIELSLAVNTSLLQLSKLYVFCTEPFRIPMAGKVEICCFDKTGTLTSDDLQVEGVAGLRPAGELTPIGDVPEETLQVLATCHTLAQLDDGIIGDPLEKATLAAIEWTLTKQDSVIPKRSKYRALKIYQRFYFSSALKRMSVVAGYMQQFSQEVQYVATVKGAPEVVQRMLSEVPDDYERTYLEYARRGARVLALASRQLGTLEAARVRELRREDVERDLRFVGFVIVSCPLKADSKAAIREIVKASHKVQMITGDNALTACHVAKELRFTRRPVLVLTRSEESADGSDETEPTEPHWHWRSIDETISEPLQRTPAAILAAYDLAVTGDGLQYLNEWRRDYLLQVIAHVSVFARFAPKQKEFVVTTLKALGYFTLMCGDGTNDVGALKHADVGVSILSNSCFKKRSELRAEAAAAAHVCPPAGGAGGAGGVGNGRPSAADVRAQARAAAEAQLSPRDRALARNRAQLASTQEMLQKTLKDIDDEQVQIVKLGDASIAAPFTSKMSSIQSVCHIIKQGRCTLVTTLQMFKILALNALIQAYCQSVLYVDGVKFSDTQATLQGLFIAACFLFIIKSKPLKVLSREAPLPNIFNVYTLSTILLQFAVHFTALVYLMVEAQARSPVRDTPVRLNIDMVAGEKEEFVPNIINSSVYIICMALQVSTFAVNHKGHPFMESLRENKFLLYAILTSSSVVVLLATGLSTDLNEMFQIIEFPADVSDGVVVN